MPLKDQNVGRETNIYPETWKSTASNDHSWSSLQTLAATFTSSRWSLLTTDSLAVILDQAELNWTGSWTQLKKKGVALDLFQKTKHWSTITFLSQVSCFHYCWNWKHKLAPIMIMFIWRWGWFVWLRRVCWNSMLLILAFTSVVLIKVMKKNKRERDEDSVRHGDQYDTQLLWFLMRHMRNRRPTRVSSVQGSLEN